MTESALKEELKKVVDISTYDPEVMEDRRERDQEQGKGSRSGSVHRVAFPFHKEARWLDDCCTRYDDSDYFARLYPLMRPTEYGGLSYDSWKSVLKCFDLASI